MQADDWRSGCVSGVMTCERQELSPDPGDAALLRLAADEARILVTIDTDFGALVYLRGAAHTGIVRLPDAPAQTRISLMEQILARHDEAEMAGAIVTVSGRRIRFSARPKSPGG